MGDPYIDVEKNVKRVVAGGPVLKISSVEGVKVRGEECMKERHFVRSGEHRAEGHGSAGVVHNYGRAVVPV